MGNLCTFSPARVCVCSHQDKEMHRPQRRNNNCNLQPHSLGHWRICVLLTCLRLSRTSRQRRVLGRVHKLGPVTPEADPGSGSGVRPPGPEFITKQWMNYLIGAGGSAGRSLNPPLEDLRCWAEPAGPWGLTSGEPGKTTFLRTECAPHATRCFLLVKLFYVATRSWTHSGPTT